jgi:hypothetical protein
VVVVLGPGGGGSTFSNHPILCLDIKGPRNTPIVARVAQWLELSLRNNSFNLKQRRVDGSIPSVGKTRLRLVLELGRLGSSPSLTFCRPALGDLLPQAVELPHLLLARLPLQFGDGSVSSGGSSFVYMGTSPNPPVSFTGVRACCGSLCVCSPAPPSPRTHTDVRARSPCALRLSAPREWGPHRGPAAISIAPPPSPSSSSSPPPSSRRPSPTRPPSRLGVRRGRCLRSPGAGDSVRR